MMFALAGGMQAASFPEAKHSIPQSWLPPAWHTLVLATDAEDTIWAAAGLIGTQTRRNAPVTVFSIVSPDGDGRYSDFDLARRADLRKALCHLELGASIDVVPLNLPNRSRLQQQVTLLSEVWPKVAAHTLLVAPRLNAVANQAARTICATAIGQLNVALASYPPVQMVPFEQQSVVNGEARLIMDAPLWEAKRDALRCFASDDHPVVDGPFDLHQTGRFARLSEEFTLTIKR